MRSVAPSRHSISVPTWSRTRARALGVPCAIRYTIGTYHHRADDWICTSIDAVYRTAAFLFGHVGIHFQARSARIRTPCGGFGDRLLSQEHTPVSAPGLATRGIWRNDYSRSVTFQYASLTNFDQLAIRMPWSAYSGFQVGRTGCLPEPHPRLLRRAVGLPLVAGHAGQHAVLPARHAALRRGTTWSMRQFLAARLAHRSIGRCSGPA